MYRREGLHQWCASPPARPGGEAQYVVNVRNTGCPKSQAWKLWVKKTPFKSDSQVYCPRVKTKFLSSTFVGLDLLIHKLIIW